MRTDTERDEDLIGLRLMTQFVDVLTPYSVIARCSCPRRLAALTCLIALLAGAPCVCAQPNGTDDTTYTSDSRPKGWVPSLRTMGHDALTIAEAPFRLSSTQGLLALGTSGVVLGAMSALDRPVYHRLHDRSGSVSATTGVLAAPGRWYDRVGPDRVALGAAGVLAASGLALQRRSFTRTSVRVFEALVYTKLVTSFTKGLISRTRPFAGKGPLTADPGEFESAHSELSMPSGHTARAFAVASVLAHEADRWYVSFPAYGLATSVGIERIRSGDHWLTDVVVGGTLGYFIGRVVSSPEIGSDRVTYTPILSTDRLGLSIQF